MTHVLESVDLPEPGSKAWVDRERHRRLRSFEQLAVLTARVVRETLGIADDGSDTRPDGYFMEPDADGGEARLAAMLRRRLLGKLDGLLMKLVGIDEGMLSSTLLPPRVSGPVGEKLMKHAQEIAGKLVDEWIAKNESTEATISKTTDLALRAAFRDDLDRALRKVLESKIQRIAEQRANEIAEEVIVAAVDRALFNEYPILRRMDAASRLGAKPPTE